MHIPVLIKEVLEYLDPKPNENFIDATLGQGGHTKEILKRIKPKGRVLGINWDKEEIKEMRRKEKLEVSHKIFFFLFGFGVIPWLIAGSYKTKGYERKYKEAWQYMIYGVIFYFGISIIILLLIILLLK